MPYRGGSVRRSQRSLGKKILDSFLIRAVGSLTIRLSYLLFVRATGPFNRRGNQGWTASESCRVASANLRMCDRRGPFCL